MWRSHEAEGNTQYLSILAYSYMTRRSSLIVERSTSDPGVIQVRAEGLGGVLAGLAIAVPTVHRRLQDALPGRGRKTTSTAEQGSKQAFHLESTLVDEQKQVELVIFSVFNARHSLNM